MRGAIDRYQPCLSYQPREALATLTTSGIAPRSSMKRLPDTSLLTGVMSRC